MRNWPVNRLGLSIHNYIVEGINGTVRSNFVHVYDNDDEKKIFNTYMHRYRDAKYFLQTFLFAELKALVSVSQAATYANLSGVTEPWNLRLTHRHHTLWSYPIKWRKEGSILGLLGLLRFRVRYAWNKNTPTLTLINAKAHTYVLTLSPFKCSYY